MDLLLIVLPAFLIFLVGFIGQKTIGFDIRSISKMALYIMSPFLAFRTFYTNPLTIDYFYIILFCLILCFCLMLIVWVTALLTKATKQQLAAMMLGGAFMNSGNYGAPIVLFALGTIGFDFAVIMMVFQSFLMNSIGLFFASLGGEEEASVRESFRRIIRMPVIHGAIAGILLQMLSLQIPAAFMEAISLVADASIPTVMLVLGMQLAVIANKRVAYRYVTWVTVIRMAVSPIIAVVIVHFMPISMLLKQVLIIQAAMPAAANTTMFAIQFGTEPDLVSFTTLITTILSIVTIPIVLFCLGI